MKAQIEDKTSKWAIESRSILRAILRECTYLPDEQARAYVRQQALAGFRKWTYKAWSLRESDDIKTRLETKHRDARAIVRELNRANQGELTMLRKVLMATYGRAGKRRWELLEPLLMPPDARQEFLQNIPDLIARKNKQESTGETAPADAHSTVSDKSEQSSTLRISHTGKLVPSRTNRNPQTDKKTKNQNQAKEDRLSAAHPLIHDIADAFLSPQLQELVRSQIRHDVMPDNPTEGFLQQPPIPAKNDRGLPMPISRVRNSIKAWYQSVQLNVLPPLPEAEWNRLRDLANTTRKPDEVLIPRRRAPVAAVRPMSMLELVVSGTRFHQRHFENRLARNLTPRAMQRMWAEIFRVCPLMSKNDEDKHWKITWGSHVLNPPQPARDPESSLKGEKRDLGTD
jgi:hypothetical protein